MVATCVVVSDAIQTFTQIRDHLLQGKASTQSQRSTNPFQADRIEEYIPPVPPRQGYGPRTPMSGDPSPIRRQ